MDKDFLEELFEPFGDVYLRKMFGGIAVFNRGLTFALLFDSILRFKADEHTIAKFEAEGMKPWEYPRKDGKVIVMNYYEVPDRLLENSGDFTLWAEQAFEVAVRADNAKPVKRRKLIA